MTEVIDRENYFDALERGRKDYHSAYYAMYSSLLGGITMDPLLMQVPVDDHVVHRGDGVFETFKCVGGAVYNLRAHLDRFAKSAQLLDFSMRWSIEEIQELVLRTVRAADKSDCAVRLMLSRGPGSFSVNPYDCDGPQLYIIVSKLKDGFMILHPEGASLGISKVSAKLSFFARVKNCNYLPNVLMKKESVDMGVDFVVGFDSRGIMTEGACENIGLVTTEGELAFPTLEGILCGTTMMRVVELAEANMPGLALRSVNLRDIAREELSEAAEIIIVGTTPNVTSVREFDGTPMPPPIPGAVASKLSELLLRDIESNSDIRTAL